ncbi:PXMP2/4 family protein 3 [Wyeomyia smithii]|uniref:PXMP2/4 family protein 3 n=1 Tax=Wyeomyia smithii TaxID=174621 RepID=UPI00246804A5|nr:PXMP2/4 family protein 3 [Wyeomyia smithii]XP_055534707.1 PXMP2/4 family protein 3 [Wyeomyia smithii]XP_055534708.1 PXMP2/4 family protein 3 [Wyeomyia smithii]XP_055534709.1 PXMP2/4 family protein 3 [Wyeomyia smithii]XP_055534711.1 PXMP2/4 family protein 3 [Wyeomyia smithii]XP_055534712.1 PXMP2/4 family protein 3 [Wyeomyia smithii]XP_055534713.1 PXMP2/4 family protein 3 [Wyeomyia smithii]XP_055534714.1 PXMP2/4 family protein 3 [Wyeomyia smithii]
MSLSKPIYTLLGSYFEQLFDHPVRTKAITSCVIATSANYCSQKIAGAKKANSNTLVAYGLFGLIFTGPLSHYFYKWLERVTEDRRFKQLLMLLGERAIFAPAITALSLYFITRFEGKSHEDGCNNMNDLYKLILVNNWKYLTLPVLINFKFVPPMLRVLVANIIGFCWIVFLSAKRRKAELRRRQAEEQRNT